MFAQPGVGYIVDCTVHCTAPYGEFWRTVCRFTCAAHSGKAPRTSQLRISYAMAYAKPVSAFLRRLIEPAAESGLAKNFAQFIDVLSRSTKITDATEAVQLPEAASSGLVSAVAGADGASAAVAKLGVEERVVALLTAIGGDTRRRIRSVRTVFVDDHLLDLFLPAADVLMTTVGAAAPSSKGPGVRAVAAVLSTLLVTGLLQVVLTVWHAGGALCGGAGGVAGRVCSRVYSVIDLPRSVTGLVMAISIIMVVRSMLGGWAKVRT